MLGSESPRNQAYIVSVEDPIRPASFNMPPFRRVHRALM